MWLDIIKSYRSLGANVHEWHEKRDSDKKDLSDSDRWRVLILSSVYFIVHGRLVEQNLANIGQNIFSEIL